MVHGALAAAKNDNALVYLVSVSDDTVFRVESATAIVEKDFPAIDLVQLKERKAKSDTPVLVYACLHVSDELLSPYLKAKGVKES